MANLQIDDINPEAVSAYQHASITQQRHIKKLLEHLILQQTQPLQAATPNQAYAFLNDDVWEGKPRSIWRIIMIIICTMSHDKRPPYFC